MLTTPYPHVRGWEAWPWYWRFFRDPLLCLIELHRRFGPLGVIENPVPGPRRGHRYLLVTGESFNRQVLNRPDDFLPSGQLAKGPPGSAQRRVRRGILKMHGDEHRRHRRLMQPPFSKTSVATTIRLMAPLIDEIIDQWQPGKPIDMFSEMRVLSNWVAANVLFGNEDIAASLHIGDLIDRWIVLEARTRRWGMIERDLPGLPYRTELKHAERLEDTIRKMLEQKRLAGLSGEDVLSMLLRAADSRGAGMKDADLIAHSVSLYGASFETTAGALAWTLFLIAQHPRCAARLHDEVSQLEEWPPDGPTLESLPFLDAVVRESLRLMPSVPFTFRRPARPLEFAGVHLRLGDKVVVSQFLTHRDPDVFPGPLPLRSLPLVRPAADSLSVYSLQRRPTDVSRRRFRHSGDKAGDRAHNAEASSDGGSAGADRRDRASRS